jgi:hypothetical protein
MFTLPFVFKTPMAPGTGERHGATVGAAVTQGLGVYGSSQALVGVNLDRALNSTNVSFNNVRLVDAGGALFQDIRGVVVQGLTVGHSAADGLLLVRVLDSSFDNVEVRSL